MIGHRQNVEELCTERRWREALECWDSSQPSRRSLLSRGPFGEGTHVSARCNNGERDRAGSASFAGEGGDESPQSKVPSARDI
jgi:hypothetical protein